MTKELLKEIIDLIQKYQDATYGCGNGKAEFQKLKQELQEKYAK